MLLAFQVTPPVPPVEMNGYQFWLLVIPMFITFATSIVTLGVQFLQNEKLKTQGIKVQETKTAVQEVHVLFNSRLTQLMAVSKLADHAEGFEAGKQAAIAEQVRAADPTGAIAGLAARTNGPPMPTPLARSGPPISSRLTPMPRRGTPRPDSRPSPCRGTSPR